VASQPIPSNVIRPTQTINTTFPDELLTRNLSVGFYHGVGSANDLENGYNQGSYRTKSTHIFGDMQGGTLSWRPRNIMGPDKEQLGLFGDDYERDLNYGAAANFSSDTLSGEDIKKDILPTLAYQRKNDLSQLFKPPGRLGWDMASNPLERAKSYVWKQMNGPDGWKANDPPQNETWGYTADYIKLIRERNKFSDTTQASRLLRSFLAAIGVDQIATGGLSADSAQEAAIRLWPYVNQNVQRRGPLGGELTTEDLQAGIQALMDTAGEERGSSKYDLRSSMAGWEGVREATESRTSGFELQEMVEITEQEQRISGQVSKDLDLNNQSNIETLEQYMQEEIDAALKISVQRGSKLSYEEDTSFAGEATRRLEDDFNYHQLNHTWIEPVQGGLGLYNVLIPTQMPGASDVVPSAVSITFLPTPHSLTRLATGLGSTLAVGRYTDRMNAARLNSIYEYAELDYSARFRSTLNMYQNDARRYTPTIQTRGVVMTEGDLTDQVFEFVTGYGLALGGAFNENQAKNVGGGFTSQFNAWANTAVKSVSAYGQRAGNQLTNAAGYEEWVRSQLTMGKETQGPNKGEPVAYGGKGSRDLFTQRFGMNRLYQPKPFLWLGSSGVQRRAQYRWGGGVATGPIT
tara:strand:+ start:2632 stop:4527 length:1896 start_codon:yes stop_codon:yes gene_type:complete